VHCTSAVTTTQEQAQLMDTENANPHLQDATLLMKSTMTAAAFGSDPDTGIQQGTDATDSTDDIYNDDGDCAAADETAAYNILLRADREVARAVIGNTKLIINQAQHANAITTYSCGT
jgi:hypothetical protein